MSNVALNMLWAFSFSTLAPVFAREVFHGDARTLGAIMSASGIGSLAAAIYLGSRATLRTLSATICWGGLVMGSSLILYASLQRFPLALLALVLVGAGNILLLASSTLSCKAWSRTTTGPDHEPVHILLQRSRLARKPPLRLPRRTPGRPRRRASQRPPRFDRDVLLLASPAPAAAGDLHPNLHAPPTGGNLFFLTRVEI
jgi:hypothetical protein